jgi:hypothetical protein
VSRLWVARAATPHDDGLLLSFDWVGTGASWEREVQAFVAGQLLQWAFDPYAQDGDPRLLLVLTAGTGDLVAVGAHERVMLADSGSGERFAATKVEVVAVAKAWQSRRFDAGGAADPERTGPRVSDVVMSAVMADVASRVPPRDARVLAVVHQDNLRSLALCHRYGPDPGVEPPASGLPAPDHCVIPPARLTAAPPGLWKPGRPTPFASVGVRHRPPRVGVKWRANDLEAGSDDLGTGL